jgi:hypothetical protein
VREAYLTQNILRACAWNWRLVGESQQTHRVRI